MEPPCKNSIKSFTVEAPDFRFGIHILVPQMDEPTPGRDIHTVSSIHCEEFVWELAELYNLPQVKSNQAVQANLIS